MSSNASPNASPNVSPNVSDTERRLRPDFASDYGARLSRRISAALLTTLAALWLTGAVWLLLHYFFSTAGEFGITRHPLEATALTIHGVLALLALFLLGWFAGRHAPAAISGRRRTSGWWLMLLLAVLVIAGGAQFFLTSAGWQTGVALVHEVLGLALVLPVLAHGWQISAAARVRDHADGRRHGHGGRRGRRGPAGRARPPRNAHS